MKKRGIVLLLTISIIMALLSGCGGSSGNGGSGGSADTDEGTEGVGEEFTIGSGQVVTRVTASEDSLAEKVGDARTIYVGAYGENFVTSTLAPIGYNNLVAISSIYDGLFFKNFETGEIENLIAESYEYIPDEEGEGVTLHIVLRPEAKFQSGEPITAEDAFNSTVKRVAEVGIVKTYIGSSVDVDNSYYEGDRDLYIKLNKYDRTVLECLCCQWLMVSNKSFDDTASDDDYWDKVDGSGPFIVEEQISGDSVLLKVDDNYWGWGVVDERPNYDYLSVKFYSEASIMMIDYEGGKLDACIGLSYSDTTRMLTKGYEHTNVKVASSGNYTVICLPSYKKEFQDPRVREAIFCAIDTDATAKSAYNSLGITMDSYVSSMAQYRKSFTTNKYDPERARELLKEAGYKDGDIELYTVVSSNDTSSVTLAEIVQSYLEDVGIKLTIDSFDFATAIQLQRNGTVDLCICTFYTMNSDISGCFIQLPEGSYNQAAWLTQLDSELARKLEEGRYEEDEAKAQEDYYWIQDWLDENMWYIPVVEYNTAFVCKDYVDDSGFYNLMHVRDIRNLDLKTAE